MKGCARFLHSSLRVFSSLIVLSGPPLPGRWALAHALTLRLGAIRRSPSTPSDELAELASGGRPLIVDGQLATREARARVLALAADERLLVEWMCPRAEADREVYHRFASRPRCVAEEELARYLADAARREPCDEREAPLALVGAGMPLGDQLLRVIAQLRPRPLPEPPSTRTPTVLVVEDELDQRDMVAEIVGELGYAVERAPDASVALALVEAGGIDLVVSDHAMPGMSGVELAQELRRRFPSVKSILLTGYGDLQVCNDALHAHAVTVLSKPFRVVDLARVLEEAIAV
jgi:CheY-like chemotaxis protein